MNIVCFVFFVPVDTSATMASLGMGGQEMPDPSKPTAKFKVEYFFVFVPLPLTLKAVNTIGNYSKQLLA